MESESLHQPTCIGQPPSPPASRWPLAFVICTSLVLAAALLALHKATELAARMRPEMMLDLPTALSKMLAVGMSLEQVIAACTINPARAIGWDDRIGRLEVGREADVAVLELVDSPIALRDCVGGELTTDRWLRACHTIRAGHVVSAAAAPES